MEVSAFDLLGERRNVRMLFVAILAVCERSVIYGYIQRAEMTYHAIT